MLGGMAAIVLFRAVPRHRRLGAISGMPTEPRERDEGIDAGKMSEVHRAIRMLKTSELRAIGFWCGSLRAGVGPDDWRLRVIAEEHAADVESGRPFLPHPGRLIAALGGRSYDIRVSRYLAAGIPVRGYFGYGVCRCCGTELGTSDLTDGAWVWPEGLEHYLQTHELPLPAEFRSTVATNGYQVPLAPGTELDRDGDYDYTFWRSWVMSAYQGATS